MPHARRVRFCLLGSYCHRRRPRLKKDPPCPSSSLVYGTNQITFFVSCQIQIHKRTANETSQALSPARAPTQPACRTAPRRRSLFAPVWVSLVSSANNAVTRDGMTPITLGLCPCTCPCPHASHTAHAVPIVPFACVRCTPSPDHLNICAREYDP